MGKNSYICVLFVCTNYLHQFLGACRFLTRNMNQCLNLFIISNI